MFDQVLNTHLNAATKGVVNWKTKIWEIFISLANFENVLKTSSEDVRLRRAYSSWSRRLEDVFKISSEDEDERRLQDVFIKTNVCWAVTHFLLFGRGGGGLRCPFLKKAKCLDFVKKSVLLACIYVLKSHLKCSFKSIFK